MAIEVTEVISALETDETLRNSFLGAINQAEWAKPFLENTGKAYFEQNRENIVSPIVKEIHDKYDEDYKSLFGEERPKDKKTYEAYKEKIQSLKDSGASKYEIERWKKEADDWKKKAEGSEGAAHWKSMYEQSTSKFNEEKEQLVSQLSELKTTTRLNTVKSELTASMSGLALNKNINENLRNDTISRIITNLANNSDVVEGITIYKDEHGKPILNDLNAPITAKELVERELKKYDLIQGTATTGGGGQGKTNAQIVKNESGDEQLEIDMTNIKTKVDLTNAISESLRAQGIALNGERGRKISDATYKKYAGADMPLR